MTKGREVAISVECKCGKRLSAKDEHAGRHAKCPACGQMIEIPTPFLEPEPTLQIQEMTLSIGSLDTLISRLSVSIRITPEGAGIIFLHIHDPKSRRDGEAIMLGEAKFRELKELIAKTDETVGALKARGQMLALRDR